MKYKVIASAPTLIQLENVMENYFFGKVFVNLNDNYFYRKENNYKLSVKYRFKNNRHQAIRETE